MKAIQKRLEDVARQMREINGHIQEANWKAEVEPILVRRHVDMGTLCLGFENIQARRAEGSAQS